MAEWRDLTKPVHIRLRLSTLLVFLLAIALLVTGAFLYKIMYFIIGFSAPFLPTW